MPQEYREREDKYDVALDWQLPDLSSAVPPGGRLERDSIQLSSQYYDTPGRALLTHRLTLRSRRTDTGPGGGESDDNGWQLKVPDGTARTELRLPPDADGEVPDELRRLLTGVLAGEALQRVARIDVIRSRALIFAADGRLLAEVADDAVEARTGELAADDSVGTASRWREIEVELVDGGEDLLATVGSLLGNAGATPSTSASKLSRAVGKAPGRPEPAAGTLAAIVCAYLDEQFLVLGAGDLALRRGLLPIHSTRVASRRYRTVLRVFADLLPPERAATLDAELAWYAGLLGEVRDRQVLRQRLSVAVRSLPPELVLGPVQASIDGQLLAEQTAARDTVLAELDSARYLALMAELTDWHRQLPVNDAASAPAAKVGRYLRKADRTLRRRLAGASAAGDEPVLLHRARKAGKRLRYAAELASPELGKPARRTAKRAKRLQDLLGEHQDDAVAAEVLLRLGVAAGLRPGENGFTYGVLYARMLAGARSARGRID